MILDELVLHNVGTFAGRHSLALTPPSDGKTIVLIGGLNGTGKTTVLEAIHLALYGALAQPSGRRSGSYESYLRGLIHRGVPASEGAAVELAFHAHRSGQERRYRVRRTWRSTGASIREILTVQLDGRHDQALTETWNEHIETFLPRGIAGLFFFDGEQIEALADLQRSRRVLGSALASLLGLDLVDRLATDLSVLRRRQRTQQVPDDLRAAVEERQQAATSIRQAEEAAAAVVAAARVDSERAEKRLFELTEQYRAAGGGLLEKREAAEAAAVMLRRDLEQLEDDVRDELADVAPLLQVSKLLAGLAAQAHKEATAAREQVVVDVVADRDKALLEQLDMARVRGAARARIDQFLAADRQLRLAASEVPMIAGLRDSGPLDSLIRTGLPSAQRRLQGLLDRRLTTRAELDQAERLLVAIPDPESLAPLRAEVDATTAEVGRIKAGFDHVCERLLSLRQERGRADTAYETAMDRAARANLAADDDRRLVDHIDRVRSSLVRLRSAATRRHLDRIGELIQEALGRLLRKDKLITGVRIDADSHTVELTGLDGQELPVQQLSAGERQLLAVALLWGLARAAGQPLPVVIDTPLGRLDRSHREHLLDRYFPYASHQVILLSTDTEIDEAAWVRIHKHIGHAYRLEFDPVTNATNVQHGYLWD